MPAIPYNCDPEILIKRRGLGAAVWYHRDVLMKVRQHQLAERCSKDRQTINRLENYRFSPSVDTLFAVAKALTSLRTPGSVYELMYYAECAERFIRGYDGEDWTVGAGGYWPNLTATLNAARTEWSRRLAEQELFAMRCARQREIEASGSERKRRE